MKVIVQKFGGTSLSDENKRGMAIRHIQKSLDQGYHVVVVVSAMGRKGDPYATDTLLSLIEGHENLMTKRELDQFLCCGEIISAATFTHQLKRCGVPSLFLTGGQAGIITNNEFSSAQILTIHPERILSELIKGNVVVVTGFQGITKNGEPTTLGRGGSDTTATALGVALKAEYVDIFTDVEGIMTADPRIVEDAAYISSVTYTEICNMAHQGAKVIHPRAVEIAMQGHVPIRVRSTFSDHEGTLVGDDHQIKREKETFIDRPITGIAHVSNITQIKVFNHGGPYDIQLKVFKSMAENNISVDFINVSPVSVVYTVHDEMAHKAEGILRQLGFEPHLLPNCAKVSAIGAGMAGVPGVMAKITEALTAEDIQILQSADSHTTIWVLVHGKDMAKAVNALHRKFDLNRKEN
ncbi:aspartate kinase [Microaerobacter geothermalis]|uniref:aspartate kinase n=1 Tax=Microaerobacter geothermalis TaxID=674972 RepID=UPI001F2AC801|nr:aspartate kinase [Microaerobacter geothermalis]MCF6093175.1 aspartate kinase [Microaerobacter geothermalis]